MRLFNAHYDEYGFQPIVVFDGEGHFVTAVLRPAKRPSGAEIKPFLRRLVRAIRAHWPHTEILPSSVRPGTADSRLSRYSSAAPINARSGRTFAVRRVPWSRVRVDEQSFL